MSDSKRQSIIMIGIGLILISAVLLFFALSQPKVYTADSVASSASSQSSSSAAAENTSSNSVTQSSDSQATVYQSTPSQTATQSNQQTQSKASLQSQNTSNSEPSVTYPLNINTCTEQELATIDGIGEVRASAIIQYRDYLGGYTSVDQIKNIKGIGDKLYEKVAPYLTV